MKRLLKAKIPLVILLGLATALAIILAACAGPTGPAGPAGPPGQPGVQGAAGATGPEGLAGAATGTVSGTVTSTLTKAGVPGVTVTTDPQIPGVTIATGADGSYSATLPVGYYTITFQKDGFEEADQNVSIIAGQTQTRDITLEADAAVIVNAGKDVASSIGGSATLSGSADALDGSQVNAYQWMQVSGAPATISGANTPNPTVTLNNSLEAYKAELFKTLLKPIDRIAVQGLSPHSLEMAGAAAFRLTVTTSSGTYSDTVEVTVPLPFEISTGLSSVPVGKPVLVHAKKAASYNWTIAVPSGSNAVLDSTTSEHPSFTPDIAGKYMLTETVSGDTLEISAGTWAGVITGIDDEGRPQASACTVCHNGQVAADKFTDWSESGHSRIFTDNLNTNRTYGEQCFSCHNVGFNKTASNGGFDDASDYRAFLDSGLLGSPSPDNWKNMLTRFPNTAKLANIQCENCHGPNNGTGLHANGTIDRARVSISAEVCGSCHGEPLRHGRYQQWEESAHSNIELALVEEATVEERGATAAHCGRCHSGQGFLAWIKQGDLTKQIQGQNGNATVDELRAMGLNQAEVQPQTCAVCHEPHKLGTKSGEPNDVVLRIDGSTPMLPSGYRAVGVGRGALCITCHNTRNGARGDAVGNPTTYSAPHIAAQGDVLMGQNAYFVTVGARSPHSFIQDTCVTCHMELTPPPAELSYQLAGTNHTFEASLDICGKCHGEFNGGTLQESVEALAEDLAARMSSYLMDKLPGTITVKDYTVHEYSGKTYDVKSNAFTVDKNNIASVEPVEPHGQQGFHIRLNNPVNVEYAPQGEPAHTVSLSVLEVQLGDISDGTNVVIPASDPLVRAGWNYFLVHGDGSEGIHNPNFVIQVLNASISALR